MTKRGCGLIFVAASVIVAAFLVWWNFYIAYERTRASSPDGAWISTAYIDGTPLSSENERVHIWRGWQPHLRSLGCQVLEAKNEAPIKLNWISSGQLVVEHGFRPSDLISSVSRCGDVDVYFRRAFKPYS